MTRISSIPAESLGRLFTTILKESESIGSLKVADEKASLTVVYFASATSVQGSPGKRRLCTFHRSGSVQAPRPAWWSSNHYTSIDFTGMRAGSSISTHSSVPRWSQNENRGIDSSADDAGSTPSKRESTVSSRQQHDAFTNTP